MLRFKVHNVDAVARSKGFRRNHVYGVWGFDLGANPKRGLMVVLRNRAGETEGFYEDQGRWVSQRRRGSGLPDFAGTWHSAGAREGRAALFVVSENLPRRRPTD